MLGSDTWPQCLHSMCMNIYCIILSNSLQWHNYGVIIQWMSNDRDKQINPIQTLLKWCQYVKNLQRFLITLNSFARHTCFVSSIIKISFEHIIVQYRRLRNQMTKTQEHQDKSTIFLKCDLQIFEKHMLHYYGREPISTQIHY